MRRLDTPEHAAYRAAILAYGQDGPEAELARLRVEVSTLTEERDDLQEWAEAHDCTEGVA